MNAQNQQQTISLRILLARLAANLTQEQVATALELSINAVVELESGKRTVSTLELSKLAQLFRRPALPRGYRVDSVASSKCKFCLQFQKRRSNKLPSRFDVTEIDPTGRFLRAFDYRVDVFTLKPFVVDRFDHLSRMGEISS